MQERQCGSDSNIKWYVILNYLDLLKMSLHQWYRLAKNESGKKNTKQERWNDVKSEARKKLQEMWIYDTK